MKRDYLDRFPRTAKSVDEKPSLEYSKILLAKMAKKYRRNNQAGEKSTSKQVNSLLPHAASKFRQTVSNIHNDLNDHMEESKGRFLESVSDRLLGLKEKDALHKLLKHAAIKGWHNHQAQKSASNNFQNQNLVARAKNDPQGLLDDCLGRDRKPLEGPEDRIDASVSLASRDAPKDLPSGRKSKVVQKPTSEWYGPPSQDPLLKEALESVAAYRRDPLGPAAMKEIYERQVNIGWNPMQSPAQKKFAAPAEPSMSPAAQTYYRNGTKNIRDVIPNAREINKRIQHLYHKISQGDWNLVDDLKYLTDIWRDDWTG